MERKYANGLRNLAITAGIGLAFLVGGAANLTGCTSTSRDLNRTEQLARKTDLKQEEQEVYEFLDKLSRKMPDTFIKQRRGDMSWIYYDKSLGVSLSVNDSGSLLELSWPEKGEGCFVEVDIGGNVDICYKKCNAYTSFSYLKNFDINDEENIKIIRENINIYISSQGSITYEKRNNKWIRDYFNFNITETPGTPPITSETPADKKVLRKYRKLVERLKETYPVRD